MRFHTGKKKKRSEVQVNWSGATLSLYRQLWMKQAHRVHGLGCYTPTLKPIEMCEHTSSIIKRCGLSNFQFVCVFQSIFILKQFYSEWKIPIFLLLYCKQIFYLESQLKLVELNGERELTGQ